MWNVWKWMAAIVWCVGAAGAAGAQALPTAARLADVQVGGSFSTVSSDYGVRWKAFGFYADVDGDFHHLGLELNFHEAKAPTPVLYERTYEVGPRYVRHIGRFAPYVRAMYGRGVFNFAGPKNGQTVEIANLAYNIYTLGGGMDVKVLPGLHVRAFDYEYQEWPSFPPHGLTPSLITFGVAYHFHGGLSN